LMKETESCMRKKETAKINNPNILEDNFIIF